MVCIRIRNTTNYSKNGDYSKAIDLPCNQFYPFQAKWRKNEDFVQ